MATGLIINYAGYPATLREFYLDNGLANLASSLIQHGHNPIILDYANPDVISWFFPYKYKNEINDIVSEINQYKSKKELPPESLIKKFHEVDKKINDFTEERIKEFTYSEIIPKIKQYKVDFVGFKLWIGEGFLHSIKIAEIIKKGFNNIKIIGGGPQVDWFDEKIYSSGFGEVFDMLSHGEGEETIYKIADYIEGKIKIEEIPNIIYKENGKIKWTDIKRIEDLEILNNPVYDENVYYPVYKNKKIKVVILDESRGCPNRCSFCIHPYKSGNGWRIRDAKRIVDEMEYLKKKYNMKVFRFAGSNPPPFLKRKIASEILNRNLKIKYGAFGHARGLTYEDYKLLKESGCVSLFFGVESGSQYILDKAMNKKVKVTQIKDALKMCKDAGIYTVASIIVPAPFDTEKTIEETFEFLINSKPSSVIVNVPGALPHTDWYDKKEYYGFEFDNEEKFLKDFMTYTIKNFYPQELWNELEGYKLNGMTAKDILKIAAVFSKRLNETGISTRITDDLSLLIEVLEVNPDELMNTSLKYLLSGEKEKLENLIETINEKITEKIN